MCSLHLTVNKLNEEETKEKCWISEHISEAYGCDSCRRELEPATARVWGLAAASLGVDEVSEGALPTPEAFNPWAMASSKTREH